MSIQNNAASNSGSADAGSGSGVGSRPAGSLPGWQNPFLASTQYFYVLPARILKEIEPLLSLDYCRGPTWQLEQQLRTAADTQSGVIGFWNGQHALEHPLLLRSRPRATATIEDRIAVAYCGWLGGCRQFLQEHDDLMAALHAAADMTDQQISRHGPLHVPPNGNSHLPTEMIQRYESLCQRWRLERLIGPYLPVPVRLTHEVLTATIDRRYRLPAGLLLHTPDIYGPLTAKHLVEIQQSLADRQQDPHLSQWHQILRPSNRNKDKQLKRYIKAFALRHIWNVLWHRHGRVLPGYKGLLRQTLAVELRMKPSTVRWCLSTYT